MRLGTGETPDGVVYQQDLGERTQDEAVAMSEYDPGDGWVSVVEEGPIQYVAKKY